MVVGSFLSLEELRGLVSIVSVAPVFNIVVHDIRYCVNWWVSKDRSSFDNINKQSSIAVFTQSKFGIEVELLMARS